MTNININLWVYEQVGVSGINEKYMYRITNFYVRLNNKGEAAVAKGSI